VPLACQAEFVRVWVGGKLAGHHLLVERPTKAFLRRNGIHDSGNLYKVLWTGRGVSVSPTGGLNTHSVGSYTSPNSLDTNKPAGLTWTVSLGCFDPSVATVSRVTAHPSPFAST
jgi:hypothetical protein